MSREKAVLAYSGGLDTSIAIRQIMDDYEMDVIAVIVDVGKNPTVEESRERALKIGAKEAIAVDAREELAKRYCFPALKANALYHGEYPLVSALSRPLICEHMARIGREKGATAMAHGCTGKGNDQVRFDTSLGILAPGMRIIAPAREHPMSREEAVDYAVSKEIPVPIKKEKIYSIDENIWGRAIEAGALEDAWSEPGDDVFEFTADAEDAPDSAEYVEVGFHAGEPVSLNGRSLSPLDLIEEMNRVAGLHGFGRIDMIEDRLVGIKSREVYEAPGALALIKAHADLERICLERDVLRYKSRLAIQYGELVYNGLWFSPLKMALDAFIEETQRDVNGTVRLKFFKGSCRVTGRRSDDALYDTELATYGSGDLFSHEAAAGFAELWSLPTRVWSRVAGKDDA